MLHWPVPQQEVDWVLSLVLLPGWQSALPLVHLPVQQQEEGNSILPQR